MLVSCLRDAFVHLPTFPLEALEIFRCFNGRGRDDREHGDALCWLCSQAGEHSPVDDARAALYLYLKHRKVGAAMYIGLEQR